MWVHTSVLGWLSAQFFMYVAEGKRTTGWRANIADALLSHLCAHTALHLCSRVALTAAQDPAEGRGALGMLCWLVEPCTSPRWLLAELVCICFCIGPCCGDRSKVPPKTILANKWQLLLKYLQEKGNSTASGTRITFTFVFTAKAAWLSGKCVFPFHLEHKEVLFVCQLRKKTTEVSFSFNVLCPKHALRKCLFLPESAGSSAVCSTKHMRLDHFASCLHAILSSPKMRLNSAK